MTTPSVGCPAISVVIPTWNERHWLGRLLTSVTAQDVDAEIVVADFDSSDGTKEIARDFGCIVVEGGRPAFGRNHGAANASGRILVFIDADVELAPGTFAAVQRYLTGNRYGAVHFRSVPISTHRFVKLCYWTMHWFFSACDVCRAPRGVGSFVAVTSEAFERAGGFDERLNAAEDLAFWRSVGKVTRVKYSGVVRVHLSPRRFHVENPVGFALKCVWYGLSSLVGSRPLFSYRWVGYSRRDAIWEWRQWTELRRRSAVPAFSWPGSEELHETRD